MFVVTCLVSSSAGAASHIAANSWVRVLIMWPSFFKGGVLFWNGIERGTDFLVLRGIRHMHLYPTR